MKWNVLLAAACLAVFAVPLHAETVTVTIHKIDAKGIGVAIGNIQLADSPKGLLLTPNLKHLTPGQHGFHIHENGNCGALEKDGKSVAGLAAGGHFDPQKSGKHEGPEGHGHMGDMGALEVGADGTATHAITVPRLKLAEIKGRAIMIHEGGDNYADQPKPLGGGGGRIACGVIQ
jgi:Cu-Zn family superoxide dismutase